MRVNASKSLILLIKNNFFLFKRFKTMERQEFRTLRTLSDDTKILPVCIIFLAFKTPAYFTQTYEKVK